MSWLNTTEYEYRYKCEGGHTSIFVAHTCDREPRKCDECGEQAEYDGFNPLQLSLRGKVSYEQNGRKAFRITDGKGGVRYVSETKERYLESGDVRPSYTKSYSEHLVKEGKQDLLETQSRAEIVAARESNKKAKVSMTVPTAEESTP
jgi:hypothetical protein